MDDSAKASKVLADEAVMVVEEVSQHIDKLVDDPLAKEFGKEHKEDLLITKFGLIQSLFISADYDVHLDRR